MKKNIKTIMKSPFNGSNLKVKKTLSEAQWDKTDQSDFEIEDYACIATKSSIITFTP